jgi:23S rRNA (guanine745-N1)-methyltransferase
VPVPGALARVADRLACPVCAGPVVLAGRSVRCASGHSFDVARQGYVTLLPGRRAFAGDDPGMVAAREAFLARGHYDPIVRALVAVLPDDAAGLCVDLAGGPGHYLAAVVEGRPGLVGLDLDASTAALRRAARAHARVAAVGADVSARLPLRDGAADVVLSIFGPRNVPEIRRVLAPTGLLVVVTPTPRHLAELVEAFSLVRVDPRKPARLAEQLAGFREAGTIAVEHVAPMTHGDVVDDVLMGPSARHVDRDALLRGVAALPEPVDVTVSVTVGAYRHG